MHSDSTNFFLGTQNETKNYSTFCLSKTNYSNQTEKNTRAPESHRVKTRLECKNYKFSSEKKKKYG